MKTSRIGRRRFFGRSGVGILAMFLSGLSALAERITGKLFFARAEGKVYFTTGFKMMEVGEDSVLLWTRLCSQDVPNPVTHERRVQVFRHPIAFDEDQPTERMDGGVRACEGEVRFTISNKGNESVSHWLPARVLNDCTVNYQFGNLQADTEYGVRIEGRCHRDGEVTTVNGTFKTLPKPTQVMPANIVTSTCQYFWSFDDIERGFRTYDSMRQLKPDLFIHTGDYVYYDKPGPFGTTIEKARHQWHAMDSWSAIKEFYESVPVYMTKDDHDLLKDDAYPGMAPYGELSYEDGLSLWYENVPLKEKPYRTIRWGKDLQIWVMEGREFRSANTIPDSDEKSIWGEEQKNWFQETVESSDATFRILFNPTPVIGPDRETKKDNHANKTFGTEGRWLRKYLSQQKQMFIVNGDRHWQYVSRDRETGLFEFGSGPVSDFHAQGWDPDDVRPEHKFLRLKGGFLNITVGRDDGVPVIHFIHRDVDGSVMHTERFRA